MQRSFLQQHASISFRLDKKGFQGDRFAGN